MSFGYQVLGFGSGASGRAPYTLSYLVIGGGGGGGGQGGAGAGGGGYRNSYAADTYSGRNSSIETAPTVATGIVLTIDIGAGGGINDPSNGSQGESTVITGTGFSTITSLGGGYGNHSGPGQSGGCGGGAGFLSTSGGAGTAAQGFDGGHGLGHASPYAGGGGGGTSQDGAVTPSPSVGGAGGNGLASTITGTSVTRGGGGGGSARTGGSAGAGGTGGGGPGGTGSTGTAGTGNSGGGGGAGGHFTAAGIGGSGVVILRMPLASYSGVVTGSPGEATDGADKVLTFTGDGTYTT